MSSLSHVLHCRTCYYLVSFLIIRVLLSWLKVTPVRPRPGRFHRTAHLPWLDRQLRRLHQRQLIYHLKDQARRPPLIILSRSHFLSSTSQFWPFFDYNIYYTHLAILGLYTTYYILSKVAGLKLPKHTALQLYFFVLCLYIYSVIIDFTNVN